MDPPENKTDENHFEKMSDYPILHICSYLPGKDLLKLAQMDKKLNRIVTESKETKAKIPLILDFKKRIAIDEVMEVARKRQFPVLKLKNVKTGIAEKFSPLLQYLTRSVEHLILLGSEFKEDRSRKIKERDFRNLLQIFSTKLKICEVYDVILESSSINDDEDDSLPNKLTSLSLDSDEMLKFFAGCRKLKSFTFSGKCRDTYVYDFLTQQENLKELHITCNPAATIKVNLSRIKCPNLKELSLPAGAEPTTSEFLERQPNLTALGISISDQSLLHPIMTTICNAPKLVELDINIRCKLPAPATPSPILENRTVKRLEISESSEAIGWLLQIFRGVDSVDLFYDKMYYGEIDDETVKLDVNLHDISGVPHETIDKIRFSYAKAPFQIKFSPASIPVNIESFESAVTKFAEKFSTSIGEITIGNKNWREHGDFKLSDSFCEGLVQRLPKLTKLELFNIANRGKLLSFLELHDTCKSLKIVKVHKPNDNGPEPKKMKFEAD